MSSSPDSLTAFLDLLSQVEELSSRPMMGEYLLYSRGVLFGGVYDDRLLVKATPSALAALPTAETPYPGAKPMRLVDIDDPNALGELVARIVDELPRPRKRG